MATSPLCLTSRWDVKSFGKLSRACHSQPLIGPRIRPLSPRLRRAAAVHEVQLVDPSRDATEGLRGPLTASWHDTRHRRRGVKGDEGEGEGDEGEGEGKGEG